MAKRTLKILWCAHHKIFNVWSYFIIIHTTVKSHKAKTNLVQAKNILFFRGNRSLLILLDLLNIMNLLNQRRYTKN